MWVFSLTMINLITVYYRQFLISQQIVPSFRGALALDRFSVYPYVFNLLVVDITPHFYLPYECHDWCTPVLIHHVFRSIIPLTSSPSPAIGGACLTDHARSQFHHRSFLLPLGRSVTKVSVFTGANSGKPFPTEHNISTSSVSI